mmetsp:Transcript_102139/g.187172  ORF Transcript_102139/g.187172 Transcript_102139/m.187172 type:complete len:87 (+) Transcript_102139:230-490(+)
MLSRLGDATAAGPAVLPAAAVREGAEAGCPGALGGPIMLIMRLRWNVTLEEVSALRSLQMPMIPSLCMKNVSFSEMTMHWKCNFFK